MTIEEKNMLLDQLSVCYNRANYCKMLCEEKEKAEEAEKLEKRMKRLKLEIDSLLRELYKDWIGSANELKDKIDKSNMEIDKHIQEIKRDIEIAQNVVKVLGFLDNAIKIAGGLVP